MEFKNRETTHPGRIRLTPVENQINVYDVELLDGATQQGTPLNAENFEQFRQDILEAAVNLGIKGDKGDQGEKGDIGTYIKSITISIV